MAKKVIIAIIIAAVILFSSGAFLYAYPKEHPDNGNQKNLNTENENSFKNNEKINSITGNNYNISIQPPLEINSQKTFKIGRTIPVKFVLTDSSNVIVENISIRLYLAKIENDIAGSERLATSSGKSNDDNYFGFNAFSKKYTFNLSTKDLSIGTWRLRIDLGNGTMFSINIKLR